MKSSSVGRACRSCRWWNSIIGSIGAGVMGPVVTRLRDLFFDAVRGKATPIPRVVYVPVYTE